MPLPFKKRTKPASTTPLPDEPLSLFSKRSAAAFQLEAERRAQEARKREEETKKEVLKRARSVSGDDEKGESNPRKSPKVERHSRAETPVKADNESGSREESAASSFIMSPSGQALGAGRIAGFARSPPPTDPEPATVIIDSDDNDLPPPSTTTTTTDPQTAHRRRPSSPIEILNSPPALDDDEDPELRAYIKAARAAATAAESSPAENITVTIESRIPNTTAFPGFSLKPTKKFEDVRVAWLRQQEVHDTPVSFEDEVVLTWRGHDLYRVTTLGSLGIRKDEAGMLWCVGDEDGRGMRSSEGFSEDGRRVIVEGWLREDLLMERERKLRRENDDGVGADSHDEDGGEEESEGAEEEVPEEKLRLTLQAKDGRVVKVSVGKASETTVQILLNLWVKRNPGDEGKRVELWFDGEMLSPDTTMKDVGVEDLDTFEIHVR